MEFTWISVVDSSGRVLPLTIPKDIFEQTSLVNLVDEYSSAGEYENPIPTLFQVVDAREVEILRYAISNLDNLNIFQPDTLKQVWNFFHHIGYTCGLISLKYSALQNISLGDFQNFELLFKMATLYILPGDYKCGKYEEESTNETKVEILNAIYFFTDPFGITERPDRKTTFSCLLDNYFLVEHGFEERLFFVEMMRNKFIRTIPGIENKLLIPEIDPIFKERLIEYCNGHDVFEGFDWSNVCIAGGSVTKLLLGIHNDFPNSDLDLFLYGLKEERDLIRVVVRIVDHLNKYGYVIYQGRRGRLDILSTLTRRKIQIVVSDMPHIYYILDKFDYIHLGCAYDGVNILKTYPCAKSLSTMTTYNIARSRGGRPEKAKDMGFTIIDNPFDQMNTYKIVNSDEGLSKSNANSPMTLDLESIINEIVTPIEFRESYMEILPEINQDHKVLLGVVSEVFEGQLNFSFINSEGVVEEAARVYGEPITSRGTNGRLQVGDIVKMLTVHDNPDYRYMSRVKNESMYDSL